MPSLDRSARPRMLTALLGRSAKPLLCLLLPSIYPSLAPRPFATAAAVAFAAPSFSLTSALSSRPCFPHRGRQSSWNSCHSTRNKADDAVCLGTRTKSSLAMSRILESPSAERNKEPIFDVLSSTVLPDLTRTATTDGPLTVLEIAAGCGVHTLHLTRGIISAGKAVKWCPTDPEPQSRASIDARVETDPSPAVKESIAPAKSLTLHENGVMEGTGAEGPGGIVGTLPDPSAPLRGGKADLIVNINMIHISPWGTTVGLMKIASDTLRKGGILFCYGPYKVGGTAVESNLNFDRSLRSRDPSWGVRDLEEVVAVAEEHGLKLLKTVEMPANNLSVIYRKE